MAHEITKTDGLVLAGRTAWHGLGIVVEDAPTPRDALKIAGLDWGVEQRELFVKSFDGGEVEGVGLESAQDVFDSVSERLQPVPTHVANYRADTGMLLGVVSSGYQPISNADMADFCEALQDGNGVRCETAGSVQGGKRVWFMLKGESFAVANDDEIYPYILVSNGHDGSASFRVTPTTIRVVCSNTLHGVVPREDNGTLGNAAVSFRHTTNVMKRVQDAKQALAHYVKATDGTREVAERLAARGVNREEIQQFFLDCYTADFGDIPANPTDKPEERKRAKATSAYNSFTRRFDDDRQIAGASAWNALNAYTGLIQHDLKARGKDDAARIAKRIDSNLFGLASDRTSAALRVAYKMVG